MLCWFGGKILNTKSKNTNPIKQNLRLKEYIGWCTVFLFPFALLGLLETTGIGVAVVLIYIGINGFLLRKLIDNRIPFFNLRLEGIRNEIFISGIVIFAAALILFSKLGVQKYSFEELSLLIILFALLKGIFEQLISVNIFDLVGCKIKFPGYIAVIINTILMYALFWDKFIIASTLNRTMIIFIQLIINLISTNIFHKTKDITICALFQIIFNVIILLSCGFNIQLYLA